MTLADPATPPAMRSWRAVATGACAVSLLDALSAGAMEEVDEASVSPACIDAESLISNYYGCNEYDSVQ